jgi:DNA-binding XRE family transcriptional regulator
MSLIGLQPSSAVHQLHGKEDLMTVSIKTIQAVEAAGALAGQIARAVAEARHAKGYTIDDLALTTGLVHAEIAAVEEGSDEDPAKLKRIAVALNIPPSAFLVA